MQLTFDPIKMFVKLDHDQDGLLSVSDLILYMRDRYIKLSPADAEMIIHEYDADLDGNLTFEEFCQLALPSTNQSLRDVALMRSKASHYASHRQLSFEAESILSDLIENELRLVKKREFLKAELLKKKDFIKQKAFEQISGNQEAVTLRDLIAFLEQHGFQPRREDLEAILRRCDHNANQQLNYDEFCEMCSVNEYCYSQEELEEQ